MRTNSSLDTLTHLASMSSAKPLDMQVFDAIALAASNRDAIKALASQALLAWPLQFDLSFSSKSNDNDIMRVVVTGDRYNITFKQRIAMQAKAFSSDGAELPVEISGKSVTVKHSGDITLKIV